MTIKLILCVILFAGYGYITDRYWSSTQIERTEASMGQLDEYGKNSGSEEQQKMLQDQKDRNNLLLAGWGFVMVFCVALFGSNFRSWLQKTFPAGCLILFCFMSTGCWRPFEPVKLEVIGSNEEGFLLPLTGDGKKQTNSSNEEYLKSNMVYAKQVQIPQQWVPVGYGYTNGNWHDAAMLIKVDKSPVTKEWTADPNTGTSNKNEAIWVMTSDQVEFSTGWTITARIASKDDAVKFLHNYPNGSLGKVLDQEVRSKLAAEFGLEVTDLPMEELRKNSTPHMVKVVQSVTKFFKERGIDITNLGITGGFVYKDKSIVDTMVKVFNAEQERLIAIAATQAQQEHNKAIVLKAQGEADAIIKKKKAESDGIRMVAEARNYEVEKATKDMPSYLKMKQIENQRDLIAKWNGSYPYYFMGSGGQSPSLLLQMPTLDKQETKNDK